MGATFVACIMVAIGLKMIWECAPNLLDHPVPVRMREQIDGLLAVSGLGPEEAVRVRTPRSGSLAQVELSLAPAHCSSLAEFNERARRVQRMVESHVPAADVTIVVDAR
jgi:divalent metal cation (Fe/Co/Zn/Cd) transporter